MPLRSIVRTVSLGLLVCSFVALGGPALGQVTTSALTIGGIGAFGCNAPPMDPPILENGQQASGTAAFSYDGATQILSVTVTNTSPIVPGENNPVIRRVYFNLPALACSGATLISQTGAGGLAPAFVMSVDTDITNSNGSLVAGCFGNFGIRLQNPGGLPGSIANALAPQLPGQPNSLVIGPVVFQIQILGASESVSTLVASSFSSSLSFNPGSQYVNAAFRFDGEISPLDLDVNFISSTPVAGGGSPAGWVVGVTQVGQPVTVVMAGAPGWEGCLVAALTPGPIEVGGYIFPIGPDWVPVLTEQIPATGFSSLTFTIPPPPPAPELGGLTVYGLVVAASPDLRTISSSESFAVFVEF